jgi:DNA-directed RNA polymerase subunit RPC12/RpoP
MFRCKNCGSEMKSEMSVENELSFEILKMGPTFEKCENCGKESTYTKADYYIKKK